MTPAEEIQVEIGTDEMALESVMISMPRSARIVYKTIIEYGKITPKELIENTVLTARTVRFALTYLKKNNYVRRIPCLMDMRSSYYVISDDN